MGFIKWTRSRYVKGTEDAGKYGYSYPYWRRCRIYGLQKAFLVDWFCGRRDWSQQVEVLFRNSEWHTQQLYRSDCDQQSHQSHPDIMARVCTYHQRRLSDYSVHIALFPAYGTGNCSHQYSGVGRHWCKTDGAGTSDHEVHRMGESPYVMDAVESGVKSYSSYQSWLSEPFQIYGFTATISAPMRFTKYRFPQSGYTWIECFLRRRHSPRFQTHVPPRYDPNSLRWTTYDWSSAAAVFPATFMESLIRLLPPRCKSAIQYGEVDTRVPCSTKCSWLLKSFVHYWAQPHRIICCWLFLIRLLSNISCGIWGQFLSA